MKRQQIGLGLIVGILLGLLGGWFAAREQARAAVMSGPYADNYGPALTAIAQAKSKLQTGNTNVFKLLDGAESQITRAQEWTKRFLGDK